MKGDLSGKLALDASALIELVFSTPAGLKLREALEGEAVEACASELAIVELRYVLCRRLGWAESERRVDKLLASGYIYVEASSSLIKEASKYKCERAVSLADCFCLALARKNDCRSLFARREGDLAKEAGKKPLDVEMLFLEDYK
jgi:predicted nucleic acid-binding protein